MLKIITPETEVYDESINEFSFIKSYTLQLEHSLISISKWEAIYQKPFLGTKKKTPAEIIEYIRCMTITQNVPPKIYNYLSNENLQAINDYIAAPMTATTFSSVTNKRSKGAAITSELIYYWMVSLNIPFECEKWHLNRLLTLINICNIKNQPAKKMSKSEIIAQNKKLNQARKQQHNTKG